MRVRMLSVIALGRVGGVIGRRRRSRNLKCQASATIHASMPRSDAEVRSTQPRCQRCGRKATSRSSIFGWPTRRGRTSMPAEPRRRPPDSSTSTCRSTPPHPIPRSSSDFLGAVADKSNQPVFIHCGSANRVGAVWMIKRVLQDGWAVDRAQTEAEAIGLQNPQLVAFATGYIKEHGQKP